MKRPDIEEWILRHDFTEFADWIRSNAEPAVEFVFQQPSAEDLPPGVSRTGGAPDLPTQMEWPRDERGCFTFIAQINLEDVQGLDPSPLPQSGLLLFFLGEIIDLHQVDGRVIFVADEEGLEQRPCPADEDMISDMFQDLKPCRLEPVLGVTLPAWHAPALKLLADEHREALAEHRAELFSTDGGQILGHGFDVDDDPLTVIAINQLSGSLYDSKWQQRESARIKEIAEAWRLLFRIDSNYSWGASFQDAYSLAFFIPRADLESLEFERTSCLLLGD